MAWRAVSLVLIVAAWAAPLAGLALTRDAAYMPLAAGVVLIELTVRALHAVPPGLSSALPRPQRARDCSGLNSGGPVGGANGMPSGHVAIVAFSALGAVALEAASGRLASVRAKALAAAVAGLLIAGVAASRVAIGCHTVAQVAAGAALGALLANLFARGQARLRAGLGPEQKA